MSEYSEYLKLLERGKKLAPKIPDTSSRFTIPKAIVELIGGKTHILNFKAMSDILHRDPQHFATYLSKEVGAPYVVKTEKLILARTINPKLIQKKIEKYVKTFVLCPVCGKPDTVIVKEGKIFNLHCQVCGAKSPIPKV